MPEQDAWSALGAVPVKTEDPWTKLGAVPVEASKSAPMPTAALTAGDPRLVKDYSASQLALHNIQAARTGIGQAVTGIPGAIAGGASAIWDLLKRDPRKAAAMLGGMTQPVTATARSAGALIAPDSVQAPSDQEMTQAAQGAGTNLAATTGGAIIGAFAPKAAALIPSANIADNLMLRALNNYETAKGPIALPGTTAPAAVINAIVKATRYPRAVVQEWLAKRLAGPQDASGNLIIPSAPITPIETVAAPRSAMVGDEASRIAQAPILPREVPSTPIGVTRPTVPNFIESKLNEMRTAETPEQLYQRQQQIRNAEVPTNTAPFEKVGVEAPPQPRPGLMDEILGSQSKIINAPAINKWLGIRPEEVSRGANPGQRLITDKLIGATKEITKVNVDTALESVGADMETRLAAASGKGVTIDAQTPVYDAWGRAIKRIGAPQDAAFQKQIQGIVDDIETKYPHLDNLSPTDTHALKVELGDAIEWKGAKYGDPVNQMMVQIYRDLNDSIKTNVPGIAPIQTRWGDLFLASKGLKSGMAKDLVGKGTGAAAKVAK